MMKKLAFLISAFLASGQSAADGGPLPKDMYIRGGFNGWGIDNVLAYQGKGIYEARILISPGYHAFKVGSKDWTAEWVIDPQASVTLAPGTDYSLATRAGAEDFLFVKKTAQYRFRLDVSNAASPRLRVLNVDAPRVDAIDPHLGHTAHASMNWPTWDGKNETVRFSTPDAAAALRTYAQSTTMQLRDPGPQYVTIRESAELPTVRSGSLAFDALFALAGAEMKQDAVAEIKDGNYKGGAAIPCACFETGEKWHYVWTRDLSYAADLGLALLDPARVRNSLEFKLSALRAGVTKAPQMAGSSDGLQIIQDTGSGGSWPVSTDRVAWAFGAEQALAYLPAEERSRFAPRALKALINTLENDRIAAFDASTGLYTGEQSFLDWRDQSYAAWIVDDLASMASAKALSTNVAHYKALTLAASLAREQGEAAHAKRYGAWARELRKAINKRLWLPEAGMYSSLTAGHLDGAPMHKFDWLGQSLAIVTGVADGARARSILARYPHGPYGPPVITPQQQGMPVYHNRAIWPFVTAYGLRAAALSGSVSVADAAYASLMRGAALNLSNMENLEWQSGQPLLLDEQHPSLIGPVINSRRQLWSVGAYLGMVIGSVFGVSGTDSALALRPFITSRLRRETFAGSDSLQLNGLRIGGKRIAVRIALPPASAQEGYYSVDTISVGGRPVRQPVAWSTLADDAIIDIRLGALVPGDQQMRHAVVNPYAEDPAVFAPRDPVIASLSAGGGKATLAIGGAPQDGVTYNIYRDGVLAATGVDTSGWTGAAGPAACFALEAVFTRSGNRSHHSAPRCTGTVAEAAPGKPLRISQAGHWQLQLRYQNHSNQINLGISGGVKWVALADSAGHIVTQGVIQLPHTRSSQQAAYSTPLAAQLAAGSYTVSISDFYNMSYLQSNSTFSAAGGLEGPSNKVDLLGARLLRTR